MIYCYGQDITDKQNASTKRLVKELIRARIAPYKLIQLKNPEEIPEGTHYILCFGSKALEGLVGVGNIGVNRGTLFDTDSGSFVFPTYAPGYLHHNPGSVAQFRSDLETFRAFIELDSKGVVI